MFNEKDNLYIFALILDARRLRRYSSIVSRDLIVEIERMLSIEVEQQMNHLHLFC